MRYSGTLLETATASIVRPFADLASFRNWPTVTSVLPAPLPIFSIRLGKCPSAFVTEVKASGSLPGAGQLGLQLASAILKLGQRFRQPALDLALHFLQGVGDGSKGRAEPRRVDLGRESYDHLKQREQIRERLAVAHDHDPLFKRIHVHFKAKIKNGIGHDHHTEVDRPFRIKVFRSLFDLLSYLPTNRLDERAAGLRVVGVRQLFQFGHAGPLTIDGEHLVVRSEEHTSEL